MPHRYQKVAQKKEWDGIHRREKLGSDEEAKTVEWTAYEGRVGRTTASAEDAMDKGGGTGSSPCAFPGVRGQAQFKLKVWVDNTGNGTLDISLPHWYMLVSNLDRRDWSPPAVGEQLDPLTDKTRGVLVSTCRNLPQEASSALRS